MTATAPEKPANFDIREAIFYSGLRHWQIADQMQISEAHLSRMLRKELTPEQKTRVLQAIKALHK